MLQHTNQNPTLFEMISPAADAVIGVVQTVDVVQRELNLLIRSQPLVVDIPPECPVVLRGERIKLRLIQPGDTVRIKVLHAAGTVAQQIEVVPINFLSAADKV